LHLKRSSIPIIGISYSPNIVLQNEMWIHFI
jgi:hypothetical protein